MTTIFSCHMVPASIVSCWPPPLPEPILALASHELSRTLSFITYKRKKNTRDDCISVCLVCPKQIIVSLFLFTCWGGSRARGLENVARHHHSRLWYKQVTQRSAKSYSMLTLYDNTWWKVFFISKYLSHFCYSKPKWRLLAQALPLSGLIPSWFVRVLLLWK